MTLSCGGAEEKEESKRRGEKRDGDRRKTKILLLFLFGGYGDIRGIEDRLHELVEAEEVM